MIQPIICGWNEFSSFILGGAIQREPSMNKINDYGIQPVICEWDEFSRFILIEMIPREPINEKIKD